MTQTVEWGLKWSDGEIDWFYESEEDALNDVDLYRRFPPKMLDVDGSPSDVQLAAVVKRTVTEGETELVKELTEDAEEQA